jgi:lysophospholipase L1-like esterase
MISYHIRGLGACMLGGYPHRQEDSFLHLALEELRGATTYQITTSSNTLGGFPITRVLKHLHFHGLAEDPNIMVIQFATSDLIVPIRRKRHREPSDNSAKRRALLNNSPKLFNRLIWQLQGLTGEGLQLQPVTPPPVYLKTMREITQAILDHQVIPVVMSPFVFGGSRSDRFASECNTKLKQIFAEMPKVIYVDAYTALAMHPRHRMLLADGTHLSLLGHRTVAKVLLPHLNSAVDACARIVLTLTSYLSTHYLIWISAESYI